MSRFFAFMITIMQKDHILKFIHLFLKEYISIVNILLRVEIKLILNLHITNSLT